MIPKNTILTGDCLTSLKTLPDKSVDCCVTSPPYYHLRDYHVKGQIGQEKTVQEYINSIVAVFTEVYRVLKDDGTLWLNIGDSYCGSGNGTNDYSTRDALSLKLKGNQGEPSRDNSLPIKSIFGIPWRVAFALQENGWLLRQDIIWAKPSVMPESVKDRFTKSHEYIFLCAKQPSYYFNHDEALEPANYDGRKDTYYKGGEKDHTGGAHERWPQVRGYAEKDDVTGLTSQNHGDAISCSKTTTFGVKGCTDRRDNGNAHVYTHWRNKRDVWTVNTEPSGEAHYAMFPTALITPCIKCGCPPGGIVLDPFFGGGTVGVVAVRYGRRYIGCELNPQYIKIAEKRIQAEVDKTALFNEGWINE